MTHLTAKELFKAGNREMAWMVAQLDEGFAADATRQAWEVFMQRAVERDAQIEQLASAYREAA